MANNEFFEGKISIREFLVDFFGALMPGVFFLMLLFFAIFLPFFVFYQSFFCFFNDCEYESLVNFIGNDENGKNILDEIAKIPIIFDVALFFIFLFVSYVVGTLFYRLDPKRPDYRSFIKIINTFSDSQEIDDWVVRIPKKNDKNKPSYFKKIRILFFSKRKHEISDENINNKSENYYTIPRSINKSNTFESEVQFPYNNLKMYLEKRGWLNLSEIVNWDAQKNNENSNEIYPRSKTFINALKIRLQFYFPEHCSTIIKNEAHIRLSTSMWYVCKTIMLTGVIGVLVVLSGFFIFKIFNSAEAFLHKKEIFLYGLISFSTIIVSLIFKMGIEAFLHYQRVREIFYVLETAYSASKISVEAKDRIFGGLIKLDKDGSQNS